MFDSLIQWLGCVFRAIWNSVVDYAHDFLVSLFASALDLLIYILNFFDPAEYINFSMQSVYSAIPGDVAYFMNYLNLPFCFTMLASAYIFRFTRKILTLGKF